MATLVLDKIGKLLDGEDDRKIMQEILEEKRKSKEGYGEKQT